MLTSARTTRVFNLSHRRLWLIGACTYRLQQQENMRFESKLRQVYQTKMLCTWLRVLLEVSISATGCDPLLFARAFNLHCTCTCEDKNDDHFTVCLQVNTGLPRLFVGRLAIYGSLESGVSARAIFVTREHKLTNLTRVRSVSAK